MGVAADVEDRVYRADLADFVNERAAAAVNHPVLVEAAGIEPASTIARRERLQA